MRFYGHKLSAAESAVAADPNDRDHYSYGMYICGFEHYLEATFCCCVCMLWYYINARTVGGGRRICPGMHVAERMVHPLTWGWSGLTRFD